MPGKPFRSILKPFYELIVQSRRKQMTWEEIAKLIRDKGTQCTRQGVQDYFKRRRNLRYPMGMEPEREARTAKYQDLPMRSEHPDIKQLYLSQREVQHPESTLPFSPIE